MPGPRVLRLAAGLAAAAAGWLAALAYAVDPASPLAAPVFLVRPPPGTGSARLPPSVGPPKESASAAMLEAPQRTAPVPPLAAPGPSPSRLPPRRLRLGFPRSPLPARPRGRRGPGGGGGRRCTRW